MRLLAEHGLGMIFSLSGSVGWQSGQVNTWFDSWNRSSSFAPAVTWPIFQGSANRAQNSCSAGPRDLAYITYQQTVLTALQDVESALLVFAEEQGPRYRSYFSARPREAGGM